MLLPLKNNVATVIHKLDVYMENYQQLLKVHKSQRPDDVRAPVTLIDFFSKMECVFSIPEDALFIFTSYILCQYHIVDNNGIPMAIDYIKVANDISLSRSYSKKLIHFYQKKLSELSCTFVFNLLKELPDKNDLKSILPELHRQSDEGRMVLPCYCVTEIIVLHMIENDANLVLLIDIETDKPKEKNTIFLKGSKALQNFQLTTPQENSPCVVMYGSSITNNLFCNVVDDLLWVGIKDVILSNNASHPQYSGVTLSNFKDNPFNTLINECQAQLSPITIEMAKTLSANLEQRKRQAEKIGCSLNNQNLFFLKHIFCNTFNSYKERKTNKTMYIPQQPYSATVYT